MEIHGLGHVHGPQSIQPPHQSEPIEPKAPADPIQRPDQLDISPEADMVSRIHDIPDVRADRIAEIRGQIEAGSYETDEKLDIAIGRLLDEIG